MRTRELAEAVQGGSESEREGLRSPRQGWGERGSLSGDDDHYDNDDDEHHHYDSAADHHDDDHDTAYDDDWDDYHDPDHDDYDWYDHNHYPAQRFDHYLHDHDWDDDDIAPGDDHASLDHAHAQVTAHGYPSQAEAAEVLAAREAQASGLPSGSDIHGGVRRAGERVIRPIKEPS